MDKIKYTKDEVRIDKGKKGKRKKSGKGGKKGGKCCYTRAWHKFRSICC